ncbi:hypothetical protein HMPREF9056_02193 [Actinomyces sp. oral taxon 170 str. F0386]|nr:hypothetical protein HMPREF9056_02193 [Actinomyces sp. oral taxon 170 str. F0386]
MAFSCWSTAILLLVSSARLAAAHGETRPCRVPERGLSLSDEAF